MFIQRDPIGLLGGNNVFAYAPNPVHWIDVFGLTPCSNPKPKLNTLSDKDFLTEIARRAEKKIGGTGPVNGSKKHSYADKLLQRYQKTTGQRTHLETETSYLNKNPIPVNRGTKGSARPDVYDPITGTIYDYKFVKNPGKGISQRQQNHNSNNVPFVTNQIEINP